MIRAALASNSLHLYYENGAQLQENVVFLGWSRPYEVPPVIMEVCLRQTGWSKMRERRDTRIL